MAAKLTRLTHKIAIKLHLVAESCTHWIGGWVGPRAVLNAVAKRKFPSPRRESNPRTPVVRPVAQRYTD
jgi:hypothetical protein